VSTVLLRLVVVCTPRGHCISLSIELRTVPIDFWPDEPGSTAAGPSACLLTLLSKLRAHHRLRLAENLDGNRSRVAYDVGPVTLFSDGCVQSPQFIHWPTLPRFGIRDIVSQTEIQFTVHTSYEPRTR
jgi:hypothetical protein